MNPIDHVIIQARRRLRLQCGLSTLGWLVLAAVCITLAMRVAVSMVAIAVPLWSYLVPLGIALIITGVRVGLHRPDSATVAALIDHRLKLKDRLGTALYARHLNNDPFAQQVIQDAQNVATEARLAQAFPIQFNRAWTWCALPALALAILWFTLPDDLLGWGKQRQMAARRQDQEKQAQATAQEQIIKAIAAIQKLDHPNTQSPLNPETNPDMKELAELSKQNLSTPQLRQKAAAQLSKVQDKLQQATAQKEQQVQSMQSALSRLDAQQPGPADRFAQALRRGDFAAAMKELQALAEQTKTMDPAQAQALQQQLQNLANQLAQAAQQFQQQQQQAQQAAQQAMQNAGLNQQQQQQIQQQLAQGASQQQIQQQLQQQGMSQQQAQQLAQQLQQNQQQQQQAGQCQSGCQSMSQSLSQMSQNAGPGKSGTSGASGASGGAMSQMNQQLQQMAQMQQQLQQMRTGQAQAQQAMAQLGGGSGNAGFYPLPNSCPPGPGGGQQFPNSMKIFQKSCSGGGVGPGIGKGLGGPALGQHRQMQGYQTEAKDSASQGEGRVIASWLSDGPVGAGPATVEFNHAITEARGDAEKALTEDRVPRRYHEAIKTYFNQLPQNPDEVKKSAAPAAPR